MRLEGETSNTLFETLADWEEQLKHLDVDFEEIEDNSAGPSAPDLGGPQL